MVQFGCIETLPSSSRLEWVLEQSGQATDGHFGMASAIKETYCSLLQNKITLFSNWLAHVTGAAGSGRQFMS